MSSVCSPMIVSRQSDRSVGQPINRAANGMMREILVKVVNESYEDQLKQIASPGEVDLG